MNEPVKLEKEKIYPMMTVVDNKGDIHWEHLKKVKNFMKIMEANFKVLNEKDPKYKKLL
jgi:hypothetical protein